MALRWLLLAAGLVCVSPVFGETIQLKLGGTPGKMTYQEDLLTQALVADGHKVNVTLVGEFAGSKIEAMLATGELTVAVMGETDARSAKFLPIRVPMTNNLIGKRLLFIPKGAQKDYDGVKTLADFQKLNKVAGMGKGWADVGIWTTNQLKVQGIDGDWKTLYKMVAAGNRGVDYLPRGANEMITEIAEHPELALEKNLVLIYQKDQITYVSPTEANLVPILEKALKKAAASGLIKKLVNQYYKAAFDPPLDVDARVVIDLALPPK
jgi:hypothetical protein